MGFFNSFSQTIYIYTYIHTHVYIYICALSYDFLNLAEAWLFYLVFCSIRLRFMVIYKIT